MRHPEVHRGEIVETLHGESVADPYRWLEEADSCETAALPGGALAAHHTGLHP